MDVLSSQASIAGYKAVLVGAARLGKHFPLLMTAAGTIPPARVVIMGAGVAGLQAIATARRLGAVVEVSDVRAAVKEQVESLGGKFIELPVTEGEKGEGAGGYAQEMSAEFLERQRRLLHERVAQADVVITTALVPGKPAPRLVTREMVEAMRPGSVIVDLAIDEGGNCELSSADTEVVPSRGVDPGALEPAGEPGHRRLDPLCAKRRRAPAAPGQGRRRADRPVRRNRRRLAPDSRRCDPSRPDSGSFGPLMHGIA